MKDVLKFLAEEGQALLRQSVGELGHCFCCGQERGTHAADCRLDKVLKTSFERKPAEAPTANLHLFDEWKDSDGDVLWWEIAEDALNGHVPAHVGNPFDDEWPFPGQKPLWMPIPRATLPSQAQAEKVPPTAL